jgi:hypothetical protein
MVALFTVEEEGALVLASIGVEEVDALPKLSIKIRKL